MTRGTTNAGSANPRFESASGLRPASAFVVIAGVLTFVALRGAKMALADEGEQPNTAHTAIQDPPDFEIHDTHGIPLALSVDRLRLVMSPNAMWQAHTPGHMAACISEALGGNPAPDELLKRMLPDAFRTGGEPEVIDVEGIVLGPEEALRVQAWLDTGDPVAWKEPRGHGSVARPVRGMSVERIAGTNRYGLRWRPAVLLSEAQRVEHGVKRPQAWARRVADALIKCIDEERPKGDSRSTEEQQERRREVWLALMPSQFKVVIGEVPAEAAFRLSALLKEEWVHSHQMKLRRDLTRRYPVRGVPDDDLDRVAPAGRVEALPAPGLGDPEEDGAPVFSVLGYWGTCDEDVARREERERLGLQDAEPCPTMLAPMLEERINERVYRPHPQTGLELLFARTLELPEWGFLERDPGRYAYLTSQVVRQPRRRYFREVTPPSDVPIVRTTVDASLQRCVRTVLEGVMEEHDPALAMAIAVEVETGAVLAIDALDAYDVAGFLPLLHSFTPGSTFKAVTMATALEAGVVRPDDEFDTFDGNFVTGGHRIREALGAPRGRIAAGEAIVGSSNAVMAQIGMLVEDEYFREKLAALGYGQRPGAGLGYERSGTLARLPWKLHWTHASVSFGHEVAVTFWQHTQAFLTIVRGGERVSLQLLESVEQNRILHRVAPARPERVFSEETCEAVRRMMRDGALRGTGDGVARDEIFMGTKTGTAEKVATEVCLHVELEHQQRHHECDQACRRSLKGVRVHDRSCYTSSMVTFGRLPEDEREVLVFVVVDEPRGRDKFGADVAGEAAVEILARALEQPDPRGRSLDGPQTDFLRMEAIEAGAGSPAEQPWAERTASDYGDGYTEDTW
jgi:hypothetical protein